MHSQQHPEPDQLDRLRAGLLDGQPQEKAALEAHIAGCTTCRQRGNWQSLQPGNLGLNLDTDDLQQSLRNSRRQALQAGDRRGGNAFLSYATVALLLITVSIGIWTLQSDHGGQQQLAVRDTQAIPDVYEDLEFYLWLANQKENGNSNEDSDPNNT